MTTWKKLLEQEIAHREEKFTDLVSITLTDTELITEFSNVYGSSSNAAPFTAWSLNTVYFSVNYDGLKSVKSVPRNPSDKPTYHVVG